MQIDKVAVLGAGVMGGGIAAHLANWVRRNVPSRRSHERRRGERG